jgi:ribonuclease T2
MKHATFTAALAPALVALLVPLAACKSSSYTNSSSIQPAATSDRATPHLATGSGFDYYLLNLSWSPEFCYSHPNAVECASHSTFVLHGLWPQNTNGGYPENCSNAPGPCSGLSAADFLTTARTAYRSIAIPSTLSGITSQTSMPPAEIIALFTRANPTLSPDSVAISCGHNFLTAVEVCLDKTLHPIACGPIRSCRANTVRIPPPR